MLEICPDALLLNYANPMAVNCWATDLLGVRIVGLCHSVQGTSELLARELGVPYDDVTFDCAGVNHTAWFTTFRRGDEDLIPRIREVMRARHVDGTMPLLPRVRRSVREHRARAHRADAADRATSTPSRATTPASTGRGSARRRSWSSEYLDRRWDYLEICRGPPTRPRATRRSWRRPGAMGSGTAASSRRRSSTAWSRGTPNATVYGNVRNGGADREPPGRRLRRGGVPWSTPIGVRPLPLRDRCRRRAPR